MPKKPSSAAPEEEDGVKYLSTGQYEPGFLNCEEFTELCSDTLPLSSCRAFKIFFSEEGEGFVKNYHDKRGDSELKIGEWKADPKFGLTRLITFRAPVTNAPIGPPSTKVEETQRYHLSREKLIVETATNLLDIPYGDHFRVETKYEFATTGDKSKITISTAVFFSKKTMFRGKIETGTLKESKDSFEQWIFFAKNEINRLDGKAELVPEPVKAPKAPEKAEALFGNRGLAVILLVFAIITTYLILRVMSLAKTVHELEYYLELNLRNQQQILHHEL